MNGYEKFLGLIAPWRDLYVYQTLSFVSVRHEDQYKLLNAQLNLSAFPPGRDPAASDPFKTPTIQASRIDLRGQNQNAWQLLEQFSKNGLLEARGHQTVLPGPADERVSDYLHPDGNVWQTADSLFVLTFSRGRRWDVLNSLPIERELRSASPPFQDLRDLFLEYGLDSRTIDSCVLTVHADRVVRFHADSRICGTELSLLIEAPLDVDLSDVRLTSIIKDSRAVIERFQTPASDLSWEADGDVQRAGLRRSIPAGCVASCIASYGAVPQHEAYLVDVENLPNLRRIAHELWDRDCAVLREFISAEPPLKLVQDRFEIGIATLFHLLGFSVCGFVSFGKRLSGAPDTLAFSPRGDMLLIECTIDLVDNRDKLAKLLSRADRTRRVVCARGPQPPNVVPILVTALPRSELADAVSPASQQGILVLCRDDVAGLLEESALTSDAQARVDGWLASLQSLRGPFEHLS